MKITKTTLRLLAVLLIVSLTGCAMFNEGTAHYNRTITIGKELIDLKEAKAEGVISEEEYIKLKEDIMKGGPIKLDIGTKK